MRKRGAKSKVEALRQVSLFQAMSDAELETLSRHVDEVALNAGDKLATQDQHEPQMFVLVDGAARVERNGTRIADLGPGDVVGEIALIDQGPRTADVVVEEDGKAYVMHSRDFLSTLDGSPGFAKAVLKALAGRLRSADDQLV